jgi:hypothetical protein
MLWQCDYYPDSIPTDISFGEVICIYYKQREIPELVKKMFTGKVDKLWKNYKKRLAEILGTENRSVEDRLMLAIEDTRK